MTENTRANTSAITVEKATSLKAKPADSTLGFGRFFSDHMYLCDYDSAQGWHSPRITPYQPLALDPGASVLHYGQALFEGMKAFRGVDGKIRLFRVKKNWERLCAGAERLCMQAPPLDIFTAALTRFTQVEESWIPHSPETALYLRPTLIGSEAFLGVRPSENYIFYVIGSPVGGYYAKRSDTVDIWVETRYARCAPGGIGATKAGGNYAASLLAATEAKKNGYAQVLWLDACHKRNIEEVGTMNVFFRLKDKVVTPPLSGTILPGVMRDSVLQMLAKMNVPHEERTITIDEVVTAHKRGELLEVFGSGTAASISPVGKLGFSDHSITIGNGSTGELASELYKNITDVQYGKAPDTLGWTTIL